MPVEFQRFLERCKGLFIILTKKTMTPNDLRIGNLVKYNGIFVKIDEILSPKPLDDNRYADKYCLNLFDGAGTIFCSIDDIEPINIDGNLLERLGFELDWDSDFVINYENKKNHKISYLIKKRAEYHSDGFRYLGSYFTHIKYVHQLQNIFFVITNEELILNWLT